MMSRLTSETARRVTYAAGAALLVLLSAPPSSACSCDRIGPAQSFKNAEVVFRGKIERISKEKERIYFRVSSVWKGRVGQQTEMTLKIAGGDCLGFPETVAVGNELLVYAFRGHFRSPTIKELLTDICLRTRLIKYAEEDLKYLGPGYRPLINYY